MSCTTAIQLGSKFSSATESTPIQRAVDRARIADIDVQILELQAQILELQQEKNSRQDRLDAYTYPVLTLPNEIVGEIFVNFLPVYPRRSPLIGPQSPSFLGQICREGRSIALTTPALWRASTLFFDRKHFKQQLQIVETFLQCSGSCHLSLGLGNVNYKTAANPGPEMVGRLFLETTTPYCARWEYLELSMPALPLFYIDGPLPVLRRVQSESIGFGSHRRPGGTSTSGLLLSSIHLACYHDFFDTRLPWSQLTVVKIKTIRVIELMGVLSQAVNLICCRLDGVSTFQEHQFGKDVTLPCLETLVLSSGNVGVDSTEWLDEPAFPALRRLQVQETFLRWDPVATLVSLISRWGCSLEELCVTQSLFTSDQYQNVFPRSRLRGSFGMESWKLMWTRKWNDC